MHEQFIVLRVMIAWLLAGSLFLAIPATQCRGSDEVGGDATITLDVKNEPLRNVLARISKVTKWEIKVPEKLADRPITQTLYQAPMEEGLRSILRDAGVENFLLIHDEGKRSITVFDMGSPSSPAQTADRPAAQSGVLAPVRVPPPDIRPDPMLNRTAINKKIETPRKKLRSERRVQAEED